MAPPLSSPGVSSLPVPEGDLPFVLSGPKTQVQSRAGNTYGSCVVGVGRREVAVDKFVHQGFFSSLRHNNCSCGLGMPWNQVSPGH